VQALAEIYSVSMNSQLKASGVMTITVIIYWDWYKSLCLGFFLAEPE